MKKLLIASAALAMVAGTAQAQSSVTIYGAYGNSVTNTKTNGVSAATEAQNASRDHLSTTALGIKGTEDLGNGLSAFFVLEGDLSGNGVLGGVTTTVANTGAAATGTETTNIFNRHAHAGISSKTLGTLSAGRQNDSVKDTEGLAQVYNLSDNLANKTRIGDRIANSVKYAMPVWNGLGATYTTSNNPADAALDAGDSTTRHNSFAITYKVPVNGGIDVAFAQGKEEASQAQTGKTTRISARTNVMGNLTVGAAQTTNQGATSAAKTKQTLVSVNKPFGKIDVKAHYWKNNASDNVGTSTDGLDGNGYGAMAVYNFSPRTAVYAGYSDFDATSAASKSKVTTAGLVHKF
jgi:general bacterial porin, GBP family